MLRASKRQTLKAVKSFDAFPKVAEDAQKPTVRGGAFSVVAITFIVILTISEILYYSETDVKYEYSVNKELGQRLKLSFDITVAMRCEYLGADVVDLAGESRSLVTNIHKEPTLFELSDAQRQWLQAHSTFMEQHRGYRALNNILTMTHGQRMPQRNDLHKFASHDSCRLHGHIEVNRVAGNFHITTGQSVPHPRGHAHLNAFVPSNAINYSHRIDSLSFGEVVPGIINPLDGTYYTVEETQHMFQYYLQIVPTKYTSPYRSLETNQYSVTLRNRTISRKTGGHGLAGLFFKYDMSSMLVTIKEERRSIIMFLVKLCAIIGGVFATSGMISQFIGHIVHTIVGK